MSIRHWPEQERPPEKLLREGARAMSNAELLALFRRHGLRGKTALDLAHDLLVEFDGLRGLLNADQTRFCAAQGLGPARYAELQALLELVRRYLQEPLARPDGFTSPAAAREFLRARLRDLPYEVFCCFYLDNRNRLIRFEELFRGTIDGASVHPREVVRQALEHNAAAMILAHNHPSGIAEPSQADEAITRRLRDALRLVDIRLLDHLVIGDTTCVSFAERGLL